MSVQVFKFNYWWDDSEDTVKGIEKYRITRIKLQQMVEPGDEETQEEMRRRIQELQDRNRCVCVWGGEVRWGGEGWGGAG